MKRHATGPWHIDDARLHETTGQMLGVYVAAPSGGRICEVFVNCLVNTDDKCRANAHLIAAAPDLLKALQGLLSVAEGKTIRPGSDWKLIDAARVAVAKATGSTPC